MAPRYMPSRTFEERSRREIAGEKLREAQSSSWVTELRRQWESDFPEQREVASRQSLDAWTAAGRPCTPEVAGMAAGELWRELSNARMGFKRL